MHSQKSTSNRSHPYQRPGAPSLKPIRLTPRFSDFCRVTRQIAVFAEDPSGGFDVYTYDRLADDLKTSTCRCQCCGILEKSENPRRDLERRLEIQRIRFGMYHRNQKGLPILCLSVNFLTESHMVMDVFCTDSGRVGRYLMDNIEKHFVLEEQLEVSLQPMRFPGYFYPNSNPATIKNILYEVFCESLKRNLFFVEIQSESEDVQKVQIQKLVFNLRFHRFEIVHCPCCLYSETLNFEKTWKCELLRAESLILKRPIILKRSEKGTPVMTLSTDEKWIYWDINPMADCTKETCEEYLLNYDSYNHLDLDPPDSSFFIAKHTKFWSLPKTGLTSNSTDHGIHWNGEIRPYVLEGKSFRLLEDKMAPVVKDLVFKNEETRRIAGGDKLDDEIWELQRVIFWRERAELPENSEMFKKLADLQKMRSKRHLQDNSESRIREFVRQAKALKGDVRNSDCESGDVRSLEAFDRNLEKEFLEDVNEMTSEILGSGVLKNLPIPEALKTEMGVSDLSGLLLKLTNNVVQMFTPSEAPPTNSDDVDDYIPLLKFTKNVIKMYTSSEASDHVIYSIGAEIKEARNILEREHPGILEFLKTQRNNQILEYLRNIVKIHIRAMVNLQKAKDQNQNDVVWIMIENHLREFESENEESEDGISRIMDLHFPEAADDNLILRTKILASLHNLIKAYLKAPKRPEQGALFKTHVRPFFGEALRLEWETASALNPEEVTLDVFKLRQTQKALNDFFELAGILLAECTKIQNPEDVGTKIKEDRRDEDQLGVYLKQNVNRENMNDVATLIFESFHVMDTQRPDIDIDFAAELIGHRIAQRLPGLISTPRSESPKDQVIRRIKNLAVNSWRSRRIVNELYSILEKSEDVKNSISKFKTALVDVLCSGATVTIDGRVQPGIVTIALDVFYKALEALETDGVGVQNLIEVGKYEMRLF